MRIPFKVVAAAAIAVLSLVACSPANVAGNYTMTVVNGANGCNFSNWTQGQTSTNIAVTVTQSDANATAVVGGWVGTYMEVVLGSRTFTGTVDGDRVSLTLYGTRQNKQGSCSYTVTAHIGGESKGDFLSGTIDYTTATNGSPDCGALTGCHTVQTYNGTRPPPAM